jgi:hypothetical protein
VFCSVQVAKKITQKTKLTHTRAQAHMHNHWHHTKQIQQAQNHAKHKQSFSPCLLLRWEARIQAGKLITPAWWPGVAPPRRSFKNSSVFKFLYVFFGITFHAYHESGFGFDEEEEIKSRCEVNKVRINYLFPVISVSKTNCEAPPCSRPEFESSFLFVLRRFRLLTCLAAIPFEAR